MDIKKMSVKDLKALAYDQLAQIEQSQNNLKIINAELAERNKPMSEEIESTEEVNAPVEETPTEEVAVESAE